MKSIYVFVLIIFLSAGCATPAYKEILKEKPVYNSSSFDVSQNILYQATLRAMFAKSFFIEKEDEEKGFILAKRSFQRGRKTVVLLLQAKIIPCETNKVNLYLNAFQTTERCFVADRTRFFMWLIPLPGGGGKEATSIKEAEAVIEDREFYQNLFTEINAQVRNAEKSQGAYQPAQKNIPAEVVKPIEATQDNTPVAAKATEEPEVLDK